MRELACRWFLGLGIVVRSDAAVLYLPSQFLGGAVSVSKGEIYECSVVRRFGANR